MPLDKDINEDLVVRDSRTGEVFARFNSKEDKVCFLDTLKNMVDKTERNKEEGYKCGNCAAYPCFRTMMSEAFFDKDSQFMQRVFTINPNVKITYEKRAREEAERFAGLCFQHVRQCRQECHFYIEDKPEDRGFWPSGICKKDNSKVVYDQECHIGEMKKSRL